MNCPQQLSNFNGINDGGMLRRGTRCESANEVRGDIVLGTTRRNRVAEHSSAHFPGPMRGINDALGFDLLQDRQ